MEKHADTFPPGKASSFRLSSGRAARRLLPVVLGLSGAGFLAGRPTCLPDTQAAMALLPPPKPVVRTWPGQGDPEVERVRRCIVKREAEGDYTAVEPSRRWFGAYQFAPRTSDTAARRMKRHDLVGITADQWSKEDQDAAFYVIYDRGRGKKHWEKSRYECF